MEADEFQFMHSTNVDYIEVRVAVRKGSDLTEERILSKLMGDTRVEGVAVIRNDGFGNLISDMSTFKTRRYD